MDQFPDVPVLRWNGPELVGALRDFEKVLRDAGLSENTVQTYVGRSSTFVRWLLGEYAPRGPNDAPSEASTTTAATLGPSVLEDLASNMPQDQIVQVLHDYAVVTGYDASLADLRGAVGDSVDLTTAAHRAAVINWLRAWGCRHLRRADEDKTSEALAHWWETAKERFPAPGILITDLGDAELADIETTYNALATAPAAGRALHDRLVSVTFGDTAAAKTFFALRPAAFPPWDEPIRLAFGWRAGGGAAYVQLLRSAASTLDSLAIRLGVAITDLPTMLGRPDSSVAKLIDEYLWVRITRGL